MRLFKWYEGKQSGNLYLAVTRTKENGIICFRATRGDWSIITHGEDSATRITDKKPTKEETHNLIWTIFEELDLNRYYY